MVRKVETEAVLKLPKLKRKKVWIGGYGGHYDCLVIFHKKPVYSKEEHNLIEGNWIELLDNKYNIAGSVWPCDFKKWFGLDLENELCTAIECTTIKEVYLTANWDGNKLEGFDMHSDGW